MQSLVGRISGEATGDMVMCMLDSESGVTKLDVLEAEYVGLEIVSEGVLWYGDNLFCAFGAEGLETDTDS